MRKLILTGALAICILALTSCGKDKAEEKKPAIVEKVFEPVVEESIESYEEEKLNLDQYSVKNETSIDANTGFSWFTMAKSDLGYYFPIEASIGSHKKILFLDNASGRVVPLCNRADCSHSDEDCNAHYYDSYSITNDESDIIYNLNFMQFYDGYLYTLAYDMNGYVYLYKIAEDGSTREQCMKLYKQEASTGEGIKIGELCIHRGYVYYTHAFEENPKLRRMRLGGGEEEIIFELNGERGNMYRIRPYGDFVCFQAGQFIDDTYTEINSGIFAFNVNNGELKFIKENAIAEYFLQDSSLYYQTAGVISRYDLITGESEILFENDENLDFAVDEQYIYIGDRYALEIYDLSGKNACTVASLSGAFILSYKFGNGEYLFAEGYIGEGDEQKSGYFCLNKSGIEDGTAEWTFINN